MRMKKHELLLCSSGFGIVGATFDEPTIRSRACDAQNGIASSADVDADGFCFQLPQDDSEASDRKSVAYLASDRRTNDTIGSQQTFTVP
jgi:hypothetical protein